MPLRSPAQGLADSLRIFDQRNGQALDDGVRHALRQLGLDGSDRWWGQDDFVEILPGHGRRTRTEAMPRTMSPRAQAASASHVGQCFGVTEDIEGRCRALGSRPRFDGADLAADGSSEVVTNISRADAERPPLRKGSEMGVAPTT